MRCSECGGPIMCVQYAVYRQNGGSSGTYECMDCKRVKEWHKDGVEKIINMR